MLSQHLITRPVFESLFENYSFVMSNPVSAAMQKMLEKLSTLGLEKETAVLEKFYASVKSRASKIDNAAGKQQIIIELYDKFFKTAFPKMTDKLGIVYTPVEVVDFIIRSVNYVLSERFGKKLSDKGVHIIDPFTGTGTFITRLLQSGIISKEQLLYKYTHEIHANEIILLAYYIAAINVESVFYDVAQSEEYIPFEGIVLTDTFALAESKNTAEEHTEIIFMENNARLIKQKQSDITVIIGNPPYSVGQKNENDDNKNVSYPRLEKSIETTYAKTSAAANKKSLYDSYIKAFRWASDRLGEEGIIGFVTNGSFIDNQAMNGFRKSLSDEFSAIYCFNLRGNQRTSGEQSRKEGGKIFGSGSRAPIAITLLVKSKGNTHPAEIFYHDIGDYLTREEKLKIVSGADIQTMQWGKISPSKHHDWINHRSDDFEKFIPLGDKKDKNTKSVFETYSNGLQTNRDAWSYNFSKDAIRTNITKMINCYNFELERKQGEILNDNNIENDPTKISWSSSLKQTFENGYHIVYESKEIRQSLYRPFCKQFLYYGEKLIHRRGQFPNIFPTAEHENLVIIVNGTSGKKDFMPLIADYIPELHVLDSGSQCFPLYYYKKHVPIEGLTFEEKSDASGYEKHYAITDYIYEEYTRRFGNDIKKEDIFYYVYGLLHSPDYRERYANDLKKMLPRLPFVKSAAAFWHFASAGRKLAELHIDYESDDRQWALNEVCNTTPDYNVKQMKFAKAGKVEDKTKIIYNDSISIEGIPLRAYEYVINGKSPIEWVMERYCIKIDKDSGIVNNANEWCADERYIIDLIKKVTYLSIETMKIIEALPKLEAE